MGPTAKQGGKMVSSKQASVASREIVELANRAARAYQRDKHERRTVQPMKEYFARVLREAGFRVTEERFREMGRVLGRRGGRKAAKRRRSGEGSEPVERRGASFLQ